VSSKKSLKELMAEFDEIVAWFDGDDVDVEEAITKFEQGSKLADQIKKQLAEAKNKIVIIKDNYN